MSRWRRRVGAGAAAVGLMLLAGCGASAEERASALGDALRPVEGVTSVETSTPSEMFTTGVEATATVQTLDRATFERVAAAYRGYLKDDRDGLFGSDPTAWVESDAGRVELPTREDQAKIVGGFVERLDAGGKDVSHFDISWGGRYRVELTSADPLATARRYGTGDEALVGVGGREMTLIAELDGAGPGDPGLTSVTVAPHEPHVGDQLDAVGRAREAVADDSSVSLNLIDKELRVLLEDAGLDDVMSTHTDLADDVCPAVELQVIGSYRSLSGCGDTQPVRDLADQLDGVEVRSFRATTDPAQEIEVGLASSEHLLTVAGRDLGDRPVKLTAGGTPDGAVTVSGPPDRVAALAPVAVAAQQPKVTVTAGTSTGTSMAKDVDLELRGVPDDPQATFAAMREASWEGEIVIGVRSSGTDNAQVRWRSSATGTAQDARATRSDGDDLTAADQALVDAWDATAG